jgi:hypothetical protein
MAAKAEAMSSIAKTSKTHNDLINIFLITIQNNPSRIK